MPAPVVHILEVPDYEQQVRRGADLLREGNVVVLPTETVYGAAAMMGKEAGHVRLKALRNSVEPKAFTPHLARREHAREFLGDISDVAARMMRKLWPGPVGLQFDVAADRRNQVAQKFGVAEGDLFDGDTITLRCPDHPVFEDVVSALQAPVIVTLAGGSANSRGNDLAAELDGKADLIFDAGLSRFSKPSTIVKITGDTYKIVRAGVYDERIIERMLKTTVLFVCSGNTCRSPMAEAIARKILADRLGVAQEDLDHKGMEVISAGAFAMPGARAAAPAIEAVKALGADLTRHRSRSLSVELIHQADVIYTMSRNHTYAVTALVPGASDKVDTLDPEQDIEDPIGGDLELYNELAGQMVKLIDTRLRERVLP